MIRASMAVQKKLSLPIKTRLLGVNKDDTHLKHYTLNKITEIFSKMPLRMMKISSKFTGHTVQVDFLDLYR